MTTEPIRHTAVEKSAASPLRRLDLNLLRVFEAVMRHRSIAGASRELFLTPSGISHSMARLRAALSDRLFVPTASGMEPTSRALELAPHIRAGLERIEAAFDAKTFDPKTAVRTFRIACSDYCAVMLLPRLVPRIAASAPGIDLRVFPGNRLDTVRQLDDGRIDLVLSWIGELPERIRRRPLWSDAECLVVRPGHPLTAKTPTREDLLAHPHVVIELTGSHDGKDAGFVEDRGIVRRVWIEGLLLEIREDGRLSGGRSSVSVPHFGAVLPLVRATDLIGTLPRDYADEAIRRGEVVALELPEPATVATVEAIWHERGDTDPGLQWLIGEALAATR